MLDAYTKFEQMRLPTLITWFALALPVSLPMAFSLNWGGPGEYLDAGIFFGSQVIALLLSIWLCSKRKYPTVTIVARTATFCLAAYLVSWGASIYFYETLSRTGDGGGSPVLLHFALVPACILVAASAWLMSFINRTKASNHPLKRDGEPAGLPE